MALIPEIDYAPGQDTMEEVFDKINTAIQNINAVLGGMTENQSIRKTSSSDFDFEAFETAGLNFKVIEIGAWNMQTTFSLPKTHGLTVSKIASVQVWIRNDALSEVKMLTDDNAGSYSISSGSVAMELDSSGDFNSPNYNDTGINRGFIVILYLK